MAGSADRAINLALRVLGIGEVERDFKRVGSAGAKSFAEVEKAANGASQEVSEYTARLRRVAGAAKQAFANTPQLNKGGTAAVAQNRKDFVLTAVKLEQDKILKGLPESTAAFKAAAGGADAFGASLGSLRTLAAGASLAIGAIALGATKADQAFIEHERALLAFNATLATTGNRSTATGAEIQGLAEKVVRSTLQTEKAALSAAATLATVPGITKEGLDAALDSSARLADALGTDVSEQATKTAAVLTALAKGDMKALYEATDGLADPLRVLVLNLADAGKTADAQRAYLDGLRVAAGAGPDGLTLATDNLSNAWDRFKASIGEDISGPVSGWLNVIARGLDSVREKAERTRFGLLGLGLAVLGVPGLYSPGGNSSGGAGGSAVSGAVDVKGGFRDFRRAPLKIPGLRSPGDAMAAYDARFGGGGGSRRKSGGGASGGGGRSSASSEADRLKREAEQARDAADRVVDSNNDVIASYRLRANEAEAKVGLEGDALKAVERQQEIEAAARRISTDLIEKEVEARRKAAAAAHQQFDADKATREATATVEAQKAEVRDLAERYSDASDALAEFTKRQADAKSLLEELKTPLDAINDEVERAISLLRGKAIGPGDFDKRMDQLAEDLAGVRYEADKAAQAWQGFGHDVGRALSDVILNGGNARDILQELIRLPLERLLEQNVENPIANLIDGLTGNNKDKNIAAARASLPDSSRIAGAQVIMLGSSAQAAAQALTGIPVALGNPVADLASQSDSASAALGGLVPVTGQFAGALGQLIAQLSGGGGSGGGGFLGTLINLGVAAISGGAAPQASLVGSASATIAANPNLFASGTPSVPVGSDFWVGENGRERMRYHGGGRLEVMGNARSHREAGGRGGGITIIQHNNIPERADPRRTASGMARSTQGALARANRKGLAIVGGAR